MLIKKPEQYHLVRSNLDLGDKVYMVKVTWGLMDTEFIYIEHRAVWPTQNAARAAAKAHAFKFGVTDPIIID